MLAATRAELTKTITLRSAWLVLGAILGLQLLAEAQALGLYTEAVSKIAADGTIEIFVGQREPAEAAMLNGLVAASLQMSVFLPALTAVLAGQEFHSPQLGLSVLAVPRRGRLLVAKALAAAVALLVAALLIAAVSTMFNYLAIADWKPSLLLSSEAVTGQIKFLAYAVLLCLATYAITVIARSTLVGILVSVALVAVTMTQVLAASPVLDALLPVSAGRNLLLDPALSDLTSDPPQAAVVLVGWALLTMVAAGVLLARRDAR
jgi:ABC-type transport system involved in multi-copper enzyme maturation permease subunit